MQLYKPGIAWPSGDNNPWPIMEEASEDGEYYYKEDVHQELRQLRGENERLRAQLVDCEKLLAAHDPNRECGYWMRTMPPEPHPGEHKT